VIHLMQFRSIGGILARAFVVRRNNSVRAESCVAVGIGAFVVIAPRVQLCVARVAVISLPATQHHEKYRITLRAPHVLTGRQAPIQLRALVSVRSTS
jgi:hypothetical protein